MPPEQTAEPKLYGIVKTKNLAAQLSKTAISLREEMQRIIDTLQENPYPGVNQQKIAIDETKCLVSCLVRPPDSSSPGGNWYVLSYMVDEKDDGRVTVTSIEKSLYQPTGG